MINVNSYEITEKEFDLACMEQKRRTGKAKFEEKDLRYVAEQLVEAKLLLDDAVKNKIEVTDEAVAQTIENIKGNFGGEEKFQEALKQNGDTLEDLNVKIKNSLLLQNYLDQNFFSKAEVKEEEAQKYYEQYQDKFIQPVQVKASHILFGTEQKEEAVKVKDLLTNGADFTEMAKEYSKCPSKENGGDLGFFGKGKMVPEFEKAAFETEKGELTDLVQTQFGYHIIKVEDKTEEKKLAFEDVKEELTKRMKNSVADHKIKQKAAELKTGAEIKINEDKLKEKVEA